MWWASPWSAISHRTLLQSHQFCFQHFFLNYEVQRKPLLLMLAASDKANLDPQNVGLGCANGVPQG